MPPPAGRAIVASLWYFGFIPRVEYIGINTVWRYAQLDLPKPDQEVNPLAVIFENFEPAQLGPIMELDHD